MKTINQLLKNLFLIILVFLALGAIFSLFSGPSQKTPAISITQLASDINQDKVKKITETGDNLAIDYKDNASATSQKETNVSLMESLINYGVDKTRLSAVEIDIRQQQESLWSWLTPIVVFGILPLILFAVFFEIIRPGA